MQAGNSAGFNSRKVHHAKTDVIVQAKSDFTSSVFENNLLNKKKYLEKRYIIMYNIPIDGD